MKTGRLMIIALLMMFSSAVLVSSSAAVNYDGGGGGSLCYVEYGQKSAYNTHWELMMPPGNFYGAMVKAKDLEPASFYHGATWLLQRWVITGPSSVKMVWDSGKILMADSQFYNYPYDTQWYFSPTTSSNVYEYFVLVVDGTTQFSYAVGENSTTSRCVA